MCILHINWKFHLMYLHFYMKANDMKSQENTDSQYIQSVELILLLLHKQHEYFGLLLNSFHIEDSAEN